MIGVVSSPRAPSTRASWSVWLGLGLVLAAGTAVKVGCASGGLVGSEVGLPGCYSDVVAIAQARGLVGDPTPYVEVLTEYPPLTTVQWWLAMAWSSSVTGFLGVTAAVAVAATAVSLRLLGRLGTSDRRVWLWVASPTVVVATLISWDPVPVALMLGALALHRSGKDVGACVLAALGGLAKLFPLVLVPLVVWAAWSRGRRDVAIRGGAAAVAVVTVGMGLATWWGGAEAWAFVRLNGERAADWDTAWFALNVVLDRLGAGVVPVGATNVLVAVATLLGWAVVVWRGRSLPAGERWRLALPLLVWFVLAGKVYSPQFSLWLLPLMVLATADRAHHREEAMQAPIAPTGGAVDRPNPTTRAHVPTVPTWLVVAFVVADGAVLLTRFPFLAGLQGATPSLPYEVFAAALAARALALTGVLATSIPSARR